jgi:hypothetical protein
MQISVEDTAYTEATQCGQTNDLAGNVIRTLWNDLISTTKPQVLKFPLLHNRPTG